MKNSTSHLRAHFKYSRRLQVQAQLHEFPSARPI